MILYREIAVGATAYGTSGPLMSTLPASPTGGVQATNISAGFAWEPRFHKYRTMAPSGTDLMISFDGVNDHARVPASALAPIEFDCSYKSVWARSILGVTATLSAGMYTRQ